MKNIFYPLWPNPIYLTFSESGDVTAPQSKQKNLLLVLKDITKKNKTALGHFDVFSFCFLSKQNNT